MGERRGHRSARDGEAEIDVLRQQILALADADCVRPEDEGALLAALDAALAGLTGESPSAAGAGIEAFIGRVQALIDAGALAAADGGPPLETARALLAALRG